MKKIYLFLYICCTALVVAQTHKPLDTADYKARKQFLANYTKINENYSKNLKTKYQGELGRQLAKNYEEFQKEFRKKIEDKDFHHQSEFNTYINSLITKLKAKNPKIPANPQVLIAKDNTPNALSLGDGIVIVNMGLFNWLDNEDQLMAILGHELAHQILEHSLKEQQRSFNTNKNSKTKVEEINKLKINKSDKAFDLFKNIVYGSSIQRRKNEMQADSLGYVLYKNTDFNKLQYKLAYKNLQRFDTISPKVVKREVYEKLFNLPDAPFKETWMKMEDFSTYQYNQYKEKLNKDSIATHPEIDTRITHLTQLFPELKDNESASTSHSLEFDQLKKIAKMEILPNEFYSENYGAGIYALMQMMSDNNIKDQKYFDTWLGKYFTKILDARKKYQLNRYLDRIEPQKQSESYQQFLSFMWNLNLDDIQKIANYYTKKSY